ncbi:MAG: molybdopterin-guanine dinucleotide biosynthesis protein B, partial [Thiogranum sp.]
MPADMLKKSRTPVIGFAAYSGTGKTTLLKEIIPLLRGKGIRVGVIKHAHHSFDIDTPGKDSYELRMAGASQMLIASRQREALLVEKEAGCEADLSRLL